MMTIVTAAMAFMSVIAFGVVAAHGESAFEKDLFKTESGDLEITFIGHGSLMMRFGGKIVHIDPFGQLGDYSTLPKADLVLIPTDYPDHLDPVALKSIRSEGATMILTKKCTEKVAGGLVTKNGDVQTIMGIKIEAVPLQRRHKRPDGNPFIRKGRAMATC